MERKWGTTFVNVAALTRYHGRNNSVPMSRLFTFTDGSPKVRVQCYLHTADFAPPPVTRISLAFTPSAARRRRP